MSTPEEIEAQQEAQAIAQKAMDVKIPITEDALDENTKKIPKVVFIDNTEAWVEKYTDDALFAQMNELYQKYKYMENNL